MSSLIYPEQQDYSLIWRAVIVSLALHALVVVFYPALSQIELPKLPDRLEIEFFSIKAAAPSVQAVAPPTEVAKPLEPPKATPAPVVKPQTPVETPKQVLAAPSSQPSDYRVPEQVAPAKAEPAPVTPAPAAPSVSAAERAQPAANDAPAKDSKPSVAASAATTSSESEELNVGDTDAWGDYGEQLRALVGKSKQYPAIAVRRHLEGEATVVAQFVRGELVNVSLAGSSKHVPLDEEAMRMVKKAIAQLGVKDSLKKKSFKITIPVNFKLE
jgi:protein TonB